MKLTLSQYLKIGGIALGTLGALRLIFAESDGLLAVIEVHWICMIVLGLGALVWFAGAWEKKHEAALAAKIVPTVVTSSTATTIGV
jgi:hypothetical protein